MGQKRPHIINQRRKWFQSEREWTASAGLSPRWTSEPHVDPIHSLSLSPYDDVPAV